ncbi:hypothetical protein NCCP1664_28400 [Zafaria cholistanensis]|uniref:Protein-glutamine gamma-glutamyltransferase-like C-terminal domain-containing protein n=1 Tax=Zafaria cholistanensis TaxID=1682741 RepID=A0A5A7NU05_9MICC|nr:DUF4129 domain-containing protein [Zafaria cholistanensis]GER24345.1 hypothetical protein NCCP1664_28400 [Zafaria cholistanensis]
MRLPALSHPEEPYRPAADEARRQLAEELARAEYAQARPNPLLGFLEDLWRGFASWVEGLNGIGPNLGTAAVLAAAIALVVLAVAVVRPRLNRRAAAPAPGLGLSPSLTAGDYRARAARAAAAGDWSTAYVERFRALVLAAEERTLLDPQPGRTAFEATGGLGSLFPDHAPALARAATAFNALRYGDHRATSAELAALASLDDAVAAARPMAGSGPALPAAPR